jgi:signal transduction histidine kinase
MEAEKGSKTEEDLKSVQEEIARIVKITDSLLRFSRKGGPGSEKIEINDLLEKMISLIEPDMKLDNIRFVKKLDDRLLQISGNKDELRQVFLNLTTNARDAMPEGGMLTFSTENIKEGEVPFVMIKFTDTGCGIDKDKIEFVFEPFFTTKKEGKGTGLGLSTSYGIIENHGGVLSVESKVGKGTTFTIDLPVKG